MRRIILSIYFLGVSMIFSVGSYAQFDIKNKVKEKSVNRTEERIDEGIDKGIDKIENGVGKLFKKKAKTNEEQNSSENDAGETTNQKKDSQQDVNSSLQSYSKYDFVPGDQVLYFEDFAQDAIGDFPALWTTDGGGEVKTVNIASGNWFQLNKAGAIYCYTKQIAFPQNFIMEFDLIPDVEGDNRFGYTLSFYEDPDNKELDDAIYPGKKGINIEIEEEAWDTKGYNNDADQNWLEGHSSTNPVVMKKVNHVIIWAQNRRLRIYHLGAKVLDMPTNIHAGTKFNRLRFSGWNHYGTPYITNLKVTTAAPDTRSKLITEGKLVSYGIYFDVNKDVVKPESFGTISDIAKVLKENPTVNIKIVGHTDSDGNDAQNLDLSKRRAASVKNELVKTFGIEASRIESDGMGETKPIAANDTPVNKALNRRVEFVKQ